MDKWSSADSKGGGSKWMCKIKWKGVNWTKVWCLLTTCLLQWKGQKSGHGLGEI
jgi:hypothetical protein